VHCHSSRQQFPDRKNTSTTISRASVIARDNTKTLAIVITIMFTNLVVIFSLFARHFFFGPFRRPAPT
jgi:hypothetical protein